MERFPRYILLSVLAILGSAANLCGQDTSAESLPEPAESLLSDDPQFEYGQPRKIPDAVGWVFGIPEKIVLWDRRAVNHNVSAETEQNLAQYLDANGLHSTKVRINQYDPIGEWRRLGANKEVGAGWRYTVGAFDTMAYTLFPGRLFGSDGYNPYTDTVNVYSDIACLAQEQAAYAKLVHARPHPGTYAALTSLPVARLWPAKQSKSDVLDYTLVSGAPDQQYEASRIFYPEFGAEVGGDASVFVGGKIPLSLVGAGIGHAAALTIQTLLPSSRRHPAVKTCRPPKPLKLSRRHLRSNSGRRNGAGFFPWGARTADYLDATTQAHLPVRYGRALSQPPGRWGDQL